MARHPSLVSVATLALLLGAPVVSPQAPRLIVPQDIDLPDGFKIEAAVQGLDAPTMATFDDQGRLLIAESGYGGAGVPRITRVEADGSKTTILEGAPLDVPLTSITFHNGTLYAVDADTVFRISQDGSAEAILDGLPGKGDHQANQVVIHDGRLFVSVGTVTNSAVVGYDNWVFGWLRDPQRRNLTDVPCQDITLRGQSFRSEDPINGGETNTSAYAPLGTTHPPGHVVEGDTRCNGAILAVPLAALPLQNVTDVLGQPLIQVVAWGLRNPYGLEVGPDGSLYATNHGFDARGSRPIENAWDCFYRIEEGAWYGYPDFACGVPVTDPRFRTADKPAPEFLLESHPDPTPPEPIARVNSHAATNGFAFSPGGDWGPPTDAFIALFGDMAPATGTVPVPQGFKILRVDTLTGSMSDFAGNKIAGRASRYGGGGFEHPSDVAFGPDGAMYVTDWGIADITGEGVKVRDGTGVVWKISRTGGTPGRDVPSAQDGMTAASGFGPTTLLWTLVMLSLFVLAGALLWGRTGPIASARVGALAGAAGSLAMGAAAILVGVVVFSLPWFVTPRILGAILMGRRAQANILEFDAASVLAGVLVLVVLGVGLGALYALVARQRVTWRLLTGAVVWALAWWALMQFLVWPLLFPLVSDKGFPPSAFAAAFAVYGIVMGLVFLHAARRGISLGRESETRRASGDRS